VLKSSILLLLLLLLLCLLQPLLQLQPLHQKRLLLHPTHAL
jgi:hypothetical protein